jgi:hypothetical protein
MLLIKIYKKRRINGILPLKGNQQHQFQFYHAYKYSYI